MKFRHLLLSLLAVAAFSATSCQEEEKDLGLPEIKISQNELALDQGVGSTNLNVYATRNWTVSTTADWIAVNPSKGAAYSETKVTVTVLENEGYNRTGTVKFDIGYDSKTLTINQTGAQGEKSEGSGTVEDPYTVAGVIAFLETLGTAESENVVYIKGKVTAITEAFSAQYGNGTFTITDDGNGSSTPFTAYRVLYLGNKKWTASNPALAEGDDVIVAGKVVNFKGNTPETVQGTGYVYSHNGNTAGGGGSGDAGDPEGDGTEANPYNIAGIIQYTSSLAADATSDKDVYFKGVVTSVGTIDTGYGNGTFYVGTTKESETTFYCFRAMYLGNTKFTSTDQLKAGDEVVMCGKVTNYKGNTPETVASKAYIYKLNGETGGGGGGNDNPDVIFSEAFTSSQGSFTIDNKNLPSALSAIWEFSSQYSCMKATAYVSSTKTNYESESWLISPEIDLTSQTTAFLSFDHAGNYFGTKENEATLHISADGGTTWTAVAIPTYFTSYTFVSSGEISLASYVGKKIKIAFRYTSTSTKAGTWEVQNVKVYKTSTGGGTGGGGNTDETYFSETFETSQGDFTVDNKTLPSDLTYVWKHDATNKYMKASAYANSTKYATESWLISPEIDLSAATTAFLSFDHVMRYFGTANQDGTLKVTADNGTTWTDVTIPTYPDGSSWTFVSSGEISLASVVGKKIKLAFIYKSSTDAAATWEIKNVKVYKTSVGGNTGGGGGTGGGDTGNGITVTLAATSFTADSDATYGDGFKFTSSEGIVVAYYKYKSTTALVNTHTDHIRVYKNAVIVVTAPSGKTIKNLVFNCTYADKTFEMTVLEGSGSTTADTSAKTVSWSGSAAKFVGQTDKGQCQFKNIVVTME